MKIILLLTICLIFLAACNEPSSTTLNKTPVKVNTIKASVNKPEGEFWVDLDSVQPTPIKKYKSIEFKTFSKMGETDSITISPDLSGVLSTSYEIKPKDDYEGDKIFSKFKLYHGDSLLFSKDSVMAVTAFELNKEKKLLSFAIISDQGSDTFATTSDLFLLDLNTKNVLCVRKTLTNTVNAPFSSDGKGIYYLENSELYKYNYSEKTANPILGFSNSGTVILNIEEMGPSIFKVFYLKDIANQDMFVATVTVPGI